MRTRNVPIDLRKSIAGYFEFLWARVQTLNEKDRIHGSHSTLPPTPCSAQCPLTVWHPVHGRS
jgi:hypothetical protein